MACHRAVVTAPGPLRAAQVAGGGQAWVGMGRGLQEPAQIAGGARPSWAGGMKLCAQGLSLRSPAPV